jgi:pimeloyl-ACP methyl ester carboxylesterase
MRKQPKQAPWRGRPVRAGRKGTRPAPLQALGAIVRAGLVAGVLLAAGLSSTSQAATLNPTLRSRLLSVADLPAGWSVSPVTGIKGQQVRTSPCGAALVALLDPPGLPGSQIGLPYATASFVEGTALPDLHETLASGPQAQETWHSFDATLGGCRTATFVYQATKVGAIGGPLALARLGRSSSAYAWTIKVAGARSGSDANLVFFQTANYYGYLSYLDVGPPQVSALTAFARAAVAKAATGSTAPVPDSVSIASTPVQTVRTTLGTVGYRSIGNGPALVLVNGWSGTMEDWGPLLVDALAQHYRVITFDNAGIGRTQGLPPPLTIDAMADQTAAFIDALHLGRPDVLGWSMGTTIAQALAVLHPSEARRLVLCAPYPGNGAVVLPPKSVLYAKNDPTALFPADQVDAELSYDLSISSYPKAPPAPEATDAAQLTAVQQWWAGGDPAGQLVATITAPTLLADGTVDRLDPVANSHLLARLIPGARLELYPDAGHAFLFQDYSAFAALVESFLGQGRSS